MGYREGEEPLAEQDSKRAEPLYIKNYMRSVLSVRFAGKIFSYLEFLFQILFVFAIIVPL